MQRTKEKNFSVGIRKKRKSGALPDKGVLHNQNEEIKYSKEALIKG